MAKALMTDRKVGNQGVLSLTRLSKKSAFGIFAEKQCLKTMELLGNDLFGFRVFRQSQPRGAAADPGEREAMGPGSCAATLA